MKSLKKKLILIICSLIFVMLAGLGGSAFKLSVDAQRSAVSRDLAYIAEQAAQILTKDAMGKLNVLSSIASRTEISDPDVSIEEKVNILAGEVQTTECLRLNYIDKNGTSYSSTGTSYDESDQEYFQQSMEGYISVSDPIQTKHENELVVIYSVPIIHNNEIVGVLTATCDGNVLGQMLNGTKFGKTSNAFMVNAEGIMIANEDVSLVQNKYNIIEEAKTNPELKDQAAFVSRMLTGENFVDRYMKNGELHVTASAPVGDSEWFVGIEIARAEVYRDLEALFFSIVINTVLFLIVGFIVAFFVGNNITSAVSAVANHMSEIATGNFTGRLSQKYLGMKNEIGTMSKAINQMQDNVGEMITSIKDTSSEVSDNSGELKRDSEQIKKLSDAISSSINEIAEGTMVQASELVNINRLLSDFNQQLIQMSEHAVRVDESAGIIDSMAENSSSEMNHLNDSVMSVSDSFEEFHNGISKLETRINEINKITGMITEIASQTNLLSLNASIEAARAGEAGKGFAVVAGEIGRLAEQSRVSSINITNLIQGVAEDAAELIQNSDVMKDELDGQIEIIKKSIESFGKILDEVNDMQPKIADLKQSTIEIEQNKNVIIGKVDELSAVSEEISASSEEITASTEEMNQSITNVAQSAFELNDKTETMMKQVNQFQI